MLKGEHSAEPMTYIINRSIETGIVPSIYKLARVVPLYKKGSHGKCGNYRPVSLLRVTSTNKIIIVYSTHPFKLRLLRNLE